MKKNHSKKGNTNYELTPEQEEWAKRAKQGVKPEKLRNLIKEQKGLCNLSDAKLIFDKRYGTTEKNKGCHPLYAAVDHVSPSEDSYGYQIICYDLNDFKAHLPCKIFKGLRRTKAWKQLMEDWRCASERTKSIKVFKNLLKDS
jgi:hypothetical protein